jgi:hypothetical protein
MADEPNDDMAQRFSLIELDIPEKDPEIAAHSVFKAWIFKLSYRMQAVLVLALRGCDGRGKEDNAKAVTRALRGLILNQTDSTNGFSNQTGVPDKAKADAWLEDLDAYPLHFVMHTIHAAEIVGYKCPKEGIAQFWLNFYLRSVKALHLMPETEAQLDVRLGYTPAELGNMKPIKAQDPAPPPTVAVPPVAAPQEAPQGRPAARNGRSTSQATPSRPRTPQDAMKALQDALDQQKKDETHEWEAGTGTSHGRTGY